MIKNSKTSLKERLIRFKRPFYWNLGPVAVPVKTQENPISNLPFRNKN
ncbi:hypothetical protein SAMN05216294_0747 [Flagellimonas zhangzhouensis]|uniref:Uncharacterized protein n=1 Tax=Flagellimonas zhangzhouensis TaxID=1073328 RepID=A0A1H2UDJ3_9FLAO|nr:hypothetical protein SAMN05216294_0747 [Allomuricauda zhangzhouensis]SDW54087.1 hypothetical protein SAMN04487892_1546 [Allomuricauda zhangzhouensis]